MKKLLLSFVLLSLTVTFFGQITITNNDIAPIGTTIYLADDDTFSPSIVPGDAGENKTWNFVDVMANTIDTLNFVSPTATPFGTEFPEANFALSSNDIDGGDYYGYMTRNEDKFATIGYAISSEDFGEVFSHIEPENIILDFPVNYQNSYNEVCITDLIIGSPIPGADSMRTKSTVEKETIIDAWGSLTIPMGTFNTLRQRVDEEQTDSAFMKMSGIWVFVDASVDNSTNYTWWTNDVSIGFMLFSIDIDNNSGETDAISFFNGSSVGLDETEMLATKVYPNPASNLISFDFDEMITCEIVLMNQLGQIVANKSVNGQNNIQFDISNLPVGAYIYRATNNAGELLTSGKAVKN